MGIWRCDNINKSGQQCVLRQNHNGKVPCRFAERTMLADVIADAPVPTGLLVSEAKPARRKMNKTETRYANMLEARRLVGEIKSFEYEAIKLRLAATCFLTPDFFVINAVDAVEIHEVKGAHIWEDARVKIKVAAAKFKCWKFYLAQYKAGNWTVEEVRV